MGLSIYDLGGTSILGGHLLPPSDNAFDLGSVARSWRNAHFQTAIYATSVVGNWSPSADDQYDLGENSTPLEWKDLYIDGIAYIDTLYVEVAGRVNDDIAFAFGNGDDAYAIFETADADAQMLQILFKQGSANEVPVLVIADDVIAGADLGATHSIDFSGVTQPRLVLIDLDGDNWGGIGYTDDDNFGLMGSNCRVRLASNGQVYIENITGTGVANINAASVQVENDVRFGTSATQIEAPNNADGDYIVFAARDSDTDTLVEIARMAGATDPYFSMGGSQEFKFYNSGRAELKGIVSNGAEADLTIAGGVVAVTQTYHSIITQGGADDDLVTATGGSEGDILILKSNLSGTNGIVTVKNGTGANTFILAGGADFILDHIDDRLWLVHNGTEWVEISRSSNS